MRFRAGRVRTCCEHSGIPAVSYEPARPEGMGFFAPGHEKIENREQRKKAVEQAIEEITPTPPEKEAKGQKNDEDLECERQLSPMDVRILLWQL